MARVWFDPALLAATAGYQARQVEARRRELAELKLLPDGERPGLRPLMLEGRGPDAWDGEVGLPEAEAELDELAAEVARMQRRVRFLVARSTPRERGTPRQARRSRPRARASPRSRRRRQGSRSARGSPDSEPPPCPCGAAA